MKVFFSKKFYEIGIIFTIQSRLNLFLSEDTWLIKSSRILQAIFSRKLFCQPWEYIIFANAIRYFLPTTFPKHGRSFES